jgi:hypothetical protein
VVELVLQLNGMVHRRCLSGINPDNGKFFVGTKSIFNINPKFNYTDQDVDLNHGNAPGLADKLKKALKYLPELGIKNILQGDFMFDRFF